MTDFTIQEADGWEELEEIEEAVRHGGLDIGELWTAIGEGSMKVAVTILENAGFEFDEKVTFVRAIQVPDSTRGEYLRVWVKFGPREWSPRKGS